MISAILGTRRSNSIAVSWLDLKFCSERDSGSDWSEAVQVSLAS